MTSKFCHHIHQNGTFCQSPPMRGRDYCYTHLQLLGRRMQMAKARARAEKCQLNLPLPEDLHGVQVAIAHLMDAIAAPASTLAAPAYFSPRCVSPPPI